MFQKILAALDNSALSEQTFDQALELASTTGASLMLLHILSPEAEDSPHNFLPIANEPAPSLASEMLQLRQQQWEAFEAKSLDLLQSRAAKAKAAGIRTEFTQVLGSPDRNICTFARSWDADVIVIGRRGHSPLSEFFLGSVSNYVLHHAPCSVLIAQSKEPSSEAATDGQATAVL